MSGVAREAARWTNRRGAARRLLDAVLDLPLRIAQVGTSQHRKAGAASFERVTTIVELEGDGHAGHGEDIAYSSDTHEHVPGAVAAAGLEGEWTIRSLSAHLDEHPVLLPSGAMGDDKPGYHRWAVESAALDLALRQAGEDLASVAGLEWEPLRFVASMGLGSPPSADVTRAWREAIPGMGFKIDTSNDWTREVVAALAAEGGVTTVDFKGLYSGDWIDNEPLPALYEAVADGLPQALLEDANLTAGVLDALDEHALARLAWDFPITRPEDVPGVPGSHARFSQLRPAAINVKPSRFGSLERLLRTIALCDQHGIPCYAGGQFELGIGRTQVQAVASLCFPDAPNDCAPVDWHGASPGDDVTEPPLEVPAHRGFGWR